MLRIKSLLIAVAFGPPLLALPALGAELCRPADLPPGQLSIGPVTTEVGSVKAKGDTEKLGANFTFVLAKDDAKQLRKFIKERRKQPSSTTVAIKMDDVVLAKIMTPNVKGRNKLVLFGLPSAVRQDAALRFAPACND